MPRIGRKYVPEPLTPREVEAARLLPYQVIERWGYETNRYGTPDHPPVDQMPEQMRSEYFAAQRCTDASRQNGTLRQDYPQLYQADPFSDLVRVGGLTVHEWQV